MVWHRKKQCSKAESESQPSRKIRVPKPRILPPPSPWPSRMLTNGHKHRHRGKEQIIMFETAVQEKRTGMLWGVIVAFAALAALLGAGYMLIN